MELNLSQIKPQVLQNTENASLPVHFPRRYVVNSSIKELAMAKYTFIYKIFYGLQLVFYFSFSCQDVWGQNCGSHGAQPEVRPVRAGRHLQWRWWSFIYSDPEIVGNVIGNLSLPDTLFNLCGDYLFDSKCLRPL